MMSAYRLPPELLEALLNHTAEGAWANGTLVRKIPGEDGDIHQVGEVGEVIASHDVSGPEFDQLKDAIGMNPKYGYFVRFPRSFTGNEPVWVLDVKLEKVDD